jgi:hypothetical protein
MTAPATQVGLVSYNRRKTRRNGRLTLMSMCKFITPGRLGSRQRGNLVDAKQHYQNADSPA